MAYMDRGIRTPTSVSASSAKPTLVQPIDESEENSSPRIPGQQPVD
jgi:hypothetical protein